MKTIEDIDKRMANIIDMIDAGANGADFKDEFRLLQDARRNLHTSEHNFKSDMKVLKKVAGNSDDYKDIAKLVEKEYITSMITATNDIRITLSNLMRLTDGATISEVVDEKFPMHKDILQKLLVLK